MPPPAKPTLKKASLWVATTIIAAILGAAINSYWNRGRLEITFLGFSASDSETLSESAQLVPTPSKLRQLLSASVWSKDDLRLEDDVTYKSLMRALDTNEEVFTTLEENIRHFKTDEPRLQALLSQASLSERDRGEVFDIWERNDGLIYGITPITICRERAGLYEPACTPTHARRRPQVHR
jgi:hypothetical protein